MSSSNRQNAAVDVASSIAKRYVLRWAIGFVSLPVLLWAIGILTVFLLFAASLAAITASSFNGVSDGPPSIVATTLIPPDMLALYQSAGVKSQCPGLSWTIVAAIGHLETNDWRDQKVSSAGAVGPMQFMPLTWNNAGPLVVNVGKPYGEIPTSQGYALDGDGDGIADGFNPNDAVPAAARLLCANGGGNSATLRQAIYAYNNAWWYVDGGLTPQGDPYIGVIPLANELAETAGQFTDGPVIIAAGANLPGEPIKPETMAFLQQVAGIYGKPITCSTGTNHNQFTVDGNQSDHYTGNACDFGMVANGGTDDGPVGDAIAAACLTAAGDSPLLAAQEAQLGGLYTKENVPTTDGPMRVQCIWKTDQGGNHHNHVHIGARLETTG